MFTSLDRSRSQVGVSQDIDLELEKFKVSILEGSLDDSPHHDHHSLSRHCEMVPESISSWFTP